MADTTLEGRVTTLEGKVDRAEKDVTKLQASDDVHKVSNTTTEVLLTQIFEKITRVEVTSTKSLEKSTATENLAVSLQEDTVELKADVKLIKEKPAKNYEKLMWILIAILATDFCGMVLSGFIKWKSGQ